MFFFGGVCGDNVCHAHEGKECRDCPAPEWEHPPKRTHVLALLCCGIAFLMTLVLVFECRRQQQHKKLLDYIDPSTVRAAGCPQTRAAHAAAHIARR